MATLITADDFFLAVIADLRLRNVETLAINSDLDQKFEKAYEEFSKGEKAGDYFTNFSFKTNPAHGDSKQFRETMYAARFNDIISLDNPTFFRLRIKLSEEEAKRFVSAFPQRDLIGKVVSDVFAPELLENA